VCLNGLGHRTMSGKFERILAVADPGADQQPALSRALGLARLLGSEVEIFCCIYDQYLSGERFLDSEGLRRARAAMVESTYNWLESALASEDISGLNVSLQVGWHSPLHEGIVRRSEAICADLVVKDTHFHPRLERALFSNTDWALIRNLGQTLWLAKPKPVSSMPVILAAVDPCHEHDKPATLDARIMAIAMDLRRRLGGELHILHAYPRVNESTLTISAIPGAVAYPLEIPQQLLEKTHREALERLIGELDVAQYTVRLEPGQPRDVLLEYADRVRADIVVMGAVGRSALKRFVIGSTAERVLDELQCDVVVVKAEGESSRLDG